MGQKANNKPHLLNDLNFDRDINKTPIKIPLIINQLSIPSATGGTGGLFCTNDTLINYYIFLSLSQGG
jgi:hypothetical protein